MVLCAMFNITGMDSHPSTLCVEEKNFFESISFFSDIDLNYADEYLGDFIEKFARKDEIMPEDKTVGFVVINLPKKTTILAFQKKYAENFNVKKAAQEMEKKGFRVELEIE
ncbi:TA0956 family protein [Caldiplasma sukawensis]